MDMANSEIRGLQMILTPAQRRDYQTAVRNGTTANEIAVIRRDMILRHDSAWWKANRDEIMAELAKLEEEKK